MLESKSQTEKSIFIEMILNKTVVQILLIFSLAIHLIWGSIIFTGLQCQTVDPSFCAIDNCTFRPVRRGVKEINGRVRLLKVPIDNVTVNQGENSTIYSYIYRNILDFYRFVQKYYVEATVDTNCIVLTLMDVSFGKINDGTP